MLLSTCDGQKPKPGQIIKGPDYYRSSQSGHQPVLYRTTEGAKPFIVCRLADLEEAKQLNLQPSTVARNTSSSLGHPIRFFACWDAARAKFQAMCHAQIEVNRQMHQRHLLTQPASSRCVRTSKHLVG